MVADREKVHGDQILGNTGGNNSFLSEEDKRNCHTYVTSIMTITFNMFLNKENIIGCYLSFYLCHLFCRFCVYSLYVISGYIRMFA